MSDIPRYSVGRGYVIDANDDGPLVKYADHVAALLTQDRQHMEQQAAAVAAAKQRVRDELPPNGADALWYLLGQRKGVQAARDAVAAVWSAPDGLLRGLCNHADALAAIDALQTSLSGPAAVRTSEPEPPTSVAPAGEDHGALRWVTEADYDRAIEDARLQGQRDEREAAARVVEERGGYHSASEFAAAIRTREEKP